MCPGATTSGRATLRGLRSAATAKLARHEASTTTKKVFFTRFLLGVYWVFKSSSPFWLRDPTNKPAETYPNRIAENVKRNAKRSRSPPHFFFDGKKVFKKDEITCSMSANLSSFQCRNTVTFRVKENSRARLKAIDTCLTIVGLECCHDRAAVIPQATDC